MNARAALVVAAVCSDLAGCGQKGPLYLPEARTGTVVTRPNQSAPAEQSPPATESVPAPSTTPTPDSSPPASPPAPETQQPGEAPPVGDQEKPPKNGQAPRT
jgi:predicted small lipoprotein YifL